MPRRKGDEVIIVVIEDDVRWPSGSEEGGPDLKDEETAGPGDDTYFARRYVR